tara:strand:+ start:4010 stop:7030 length:3021 start_codon:yes stop_codon:yes gene_type:complete
MPVSSFKFVSPGVFINEIDNSERPAASTAIGPVIVGRSRKGLAMQPVEIASFSDFIDVFGDTVPGRGGGDIYRDGNHQTPMYGTYAAKAFLRANVRPVNYIRLLGQETSAGSTTGGDASAGWKTTNDIGPGDSTDITFGGAYGLWVFPSGSDGAMSKVSVSSEPGRLCPAPGGTAGALAAIWYMDSGSLELTGTMRAAIPTSAHRGTTCCIASDSDGVFTAIYTDSDQVAHTVQFGFNDNEDTFIRKRFNTNPQLLNTSGTFYSTQEHILLGETFEDSLRDYRTSADKNLTEAQVLHGVIYGLALSGTLSTGPHNMKGQPSREAVAGWFIGQDLSGDYESYKPAQQTKLFRLKGRGHGEWLHKNAKISIERIKASTSTVTDYGTFSVVLREIDDHDGTPVILERFDSCTLDPSSANFVAKKIGDRYNKWDATARRLKSYGDYENKSAYVYVEMSEEVEVGATDPLLLPFGYFGPPGFTPIASGSGDAGGVQNSGIKNKFVVGSGSVAKSGQSTLAAFPAGNHAAKSFLSGGRGGVGFAGLTASLFFPVDRLRLSASDGPMSDPTKAYFGFQNTRTSGSTKPARSYTDMHRLLYSGFADDPVSGQTPAKNPSGLTGVDAWTYIFSLDDVGQDASSNYYYHSGTRLRGASVAKTSYETLLNANYNRFTAPFWGGFDGFDIKKPDPLYNAGMNGISNVNEDNSYAYHTYIRAIDTVADPEYINMNLLVAPGLTQTNLTEHMIDVCAARGDALSIIDLPNVYVPSGEAYYNSKDQRTSQTTPASAASALRDRRIDSSYGCTFYPWVQTRDTNTGRLLWIPPSVAMMGVLASSEAASELWFAPAGFNRGGLSDGAAGIPIINVSERLISDDRDTLYDNKINPIASFPSSGIVVFGQKTLQERQSALDRINVRRLVIYLKKQISILANQVLFEQNTSATWLNFKALVEPLLANTKATYGIADYRLILDDTTTTPDLIDQNVLYAKIMVKPTRAIEYIAIDFVVMSTGASFDD